MKKNELIKMLNIFFDTNSSKNKIALAFLYGSRALGHPRSSSDVDIALYFSNKNLSSTACFDRINDFSYLLSKKIKQEVNILHIHNDFRHPMLYYNAIVKGIPVYIKNTFIFASVRNEAIFQMEDFSIFGPRWQLEATEKNLERLNG